MEAVTSRQLRTISLEREQYKEVQELEGKRMVKVADITKEQFMALFGIRSENEEGMLMAQEEYDNGTPWIVVARDTIMQLETLTEV